jgi:ssDNA thymidine ADP-ribosyltransferase, DarT
MMSAISKGRVPEYDSVVTDLVYLVTTTQTLAHLGATMVCTDRNAVLSVAAFRPEAECDGLVDWGLMEATWWNNTPEEPDRRERRMAECLVHQTVPWDGIRAIVTYGETRLRRRAPCWFTVPVCV